MDWQTLIALALVVLAAGSVVRRHLPRRRSAGEAPACTACPSCAVKKPVTTASLSDLMEQPFRRK